MNKTLKIDFGSDRLIGIASDLTDDHNYINALKMLNKNAELWENDEDSYMLYAEIFDDLGLYERSINFWFKFLDNYQLGDLSDCYEGLAVCYMNLGNDHFSAYYYNKLLMESDEVDEDMKEQILSDFLSTDENPLKFVYPPSIADYSEVISNGVGHMKENDFDAAVEEFEKVDEQNSSFCTARNYIAMCKIITDKPEEAEEECRKILQKKPDDVQALTTLAAVMTETDRKDEARALAQKLVAMKDVNDEECYKIATVCCENKMHAEAYNLFCKLSGDIGYDLTVNYFKAVSAFNCGRYNESFDAFDKILTVYPEAVTARYWYNKAREIRENGGQEELGYFYRLPPEIRESSLKMLAAYVRLPAHSSRRLDEEIDITDCVMWAFDEGESTSGIELKMLAARAAIKAEMDWYVRDLLLNAFLPDELKIAMLTQLAERNEENNFGVVICNIYKLVPTDKLKLGRTKRKYFIGAYAGLTAHFGIISEEYPRKFAEAAENLYAKMQDNENLDAAKDTDALAAAIFISAAIGDFNVGNRSAYDLFGVTEERVAKITEGI